MSRQDRWFFALSHDLNCCIACATVLEDMDDAQELVFEGREDWQALRDPSTNSATVRADEVEGAYFPQQPTLWTCFYRAILDIDRANSNCPIVSGITQDYFTGSLLPTSVPRDPNVARIGTACGSRKHYAKYLPAQIIKPDPNRPRYRQLLRNITGEKPKLWYNKEQYYEDYDDPFNTGSGLFDTRSANRDGDDNEQKDRNGSPSDSAVSKVPLEVAIMTIDGIYNDKNYNRDGVEATRSLLRAFDWRLPDAYWQNRRKRDLIYEFEDLMNPASTGADDTTIDWQLLCLGSEELLLDYDWYDKSGLKARGRTLQHLRGIKGVFLDMLEQQRQNRERPQEDGMKDN
ncbi:hypothetical protein AJ79_08527 [Helicocarpus griseus UAMH5409]|uniref:Uncharacterized protein n=1 Tax=Helicocarpus griseus UAMH5409 TaxID=1447875 RepID=A0A2B7WSG8_9EURO|nr:hypothetical protein AJ79_08527 [Helicocarpus griseus UAMH5409]